MSTEPRISPVPPAAAGGVPPAPAATTDDHHPSVLPAVLDRIGFSRAQFWVLMLIMAGMFFDTLEQNSTGAMGTNLKDALGIDNDQLALINTATVIGGLIGRLVGGYLADRYGRRLSLGFNLLLYTLGGLISAVAVNYEMLLASRLLVGIGLGGEFTVGIAMLSEMVATRYRGTLVSTLNIGSGGIGNFLSYGIFFLILGPFAGFFGGDDTVWRWTYVLLSVPALLVVVYRRRLPESPRYLISRGEVDAANRELTRLASDTLRRPRADAPVTPYLSAADVPARQPRVSPAAVFQGKALPRTLAIGAASWMAFGAQVTLNFLMPTLLVAKGYSISDSLLFTMIMNVGSLLGACAAAVLASRAGRRTTVTTAAVLGCLTAVAFALFAETTLLILVLGAIFQFFTMLLNTTLAAWSPEVYPTSIRAQGTSIVNGIGNVAGAVMPFAALFFFDRFSLTGVFMMVAVMYALLIVAARFGPETRGRTLEEVKEERL